MKQTQHNYLFLFIWSDALRMEHGNKSEGSREGKSGIEFSQLFLHFIIQCNFSCGRVRLY